MTPISDDSQLDFPLATRFEVVDWTTDSPVGRLLVRYGVKVWAGVQDEGRTVKIFLQDPEDPADARCTCPLGQIRASCPHPHWSAP